MFANVDNLLFTSQRAYRARRDKHVEEIEQRNVSLQRHASALLEENEQLKAQLSFLLAAGKYFVPDTPLPRSVSQPSTISLCSSPINAPQSDKEYLGFEETGDICQDHLLPMVDKPELRI